MKNLKKIKTTIYSSLLLLTILLTGWHKWFYQETVACSFIIIGLTTLFFLSVWCVDLLYNESKIINTCEMWKKIFTLQIIVGHILFAIMSVPAAFTFADIRELPRKSILWFISWLLFNIGIAFCWALKVSGKKSEI